MSSFVHTLKHSQSLPTPSSLLCSGLSCADTQRLQRVGDRQRHRSHRSARRGSHGALRATENATPTFLGRSGPFLGAGNDMKEEAEVASQRGCPFQGEGTAKMNELRAARSFTRETRLEKRAEAR